MTISGPATIGTNTAFEESNAMKILELAKVSIEFFSGIYGI